MSQSQRDRDHLVELMADMPIAMFTTFGPEGPRTIPMARQEVEPGAEMWFVTARSTQHAHALAAEPRVALSFSSRDAWVALTGRGEVVDDTDKLAELWNTSAQSSCDQLFDKLMMYQGGSKQDDDVTLVAVHAK